MFGNAEGRNLDEGDVAWMKGKGGGTHIPDTYNPPSPNINIDMHL